MAESSVSKLLCAFLIVTALATVHFNVAAAARAPTPAPAPAPTSAPAPAPAPAPTSAPAPAPSLAWARARAQAGWFSEETQPAAPLFIFGDSTLDVGTNDLIPNCSARADFYWNGIDFPSGPTGRFSNGFNTADEIAKQMGYNMSPPAYLSLVQYNSCPQNIHLGANFASGGSGILNNTGHDQFGKVMSLEEQVQQFSHFRDCMMRGSAGNALSVDRNISKAIFLISIGSNDIFEFPKGSDFVLYMFNMIDTYLKHLKGLYELGARKFGILNVPPVGCCPYARNLTKDGTCYGDANTLAQAFNSQLETTFTNFSSQAKDIKYSLANVYDMTYEIINNPKEGRGFENVESACCGNANYPCNRTASFCNRRPGFLFWDRFHPTQASSELAAAVAFDESSKFVKPISFRQLLNDN